MKKVIKENDIAIYWLENINPFFLICPWQGVHFTEGRAEGREAQLLAQIRKKMEKGKQIEVIADELEETIETIQQLYERVQTELGNKW